MRNGSAALVPLILAVMLLFWFIMFMGGANDNLAKVNGIVHHQNLEERLLKAAAAKYIQLEEQNKEAETPLSEAEMKALVDAYIARMIDKNYK